MSVKLQKEHIKLSQVICSRYCQTTAECDIIVPDIKPDILKVLRVSSEAVITQKTVQTDKVHLQGIMRIDILYIPEGDDCGNVKSISTVQDFSHTVDAVGAKPGMSLFAEAECEGMEFTVVNSRKLSLRNKISMSIKVSHICEMNITTGIDGDEPVQTRCEHLKISNCCCEAERDIVIRERLDVPSGKPDLEEILKFSAKPIPGELRLLDNKAIARGELKLCTLYCGSDGEKESMECMEHTVPFTEVLEVDGLAENMTAEIDYAVKNVYCEICRDSDGDKRILGTEITLCAYIRGTEIIECDAVRDAYGIEHEIKTEAESHNIEQLVDTVCTKATPSEKINIPDYLPDIYRICDCSAVPNIESVVPENSTVTVSGYITCNILYMSADSDAPVSGFSHVMPFSQVFDIAGVNQNSVCEAKADIAHLDYTISGPGNIELRSIVELALKAVNPENCEFISDIEYDNDSVLPPVPSITVYFIQPGDTLWSIAKRYRTTPDAILATNNVDPHNLQIGSRIYIFR